MSLRMSIAASAHDLGLALVFCYNSSASTPSTNACGVYLFPLHTKACSILPGDPLLACRWSSSDDSRTEPHRPPSPRGSGRLGREFHALPLEQKVAILDRLTGHLLDVHSVREVS